MPALRSDKADEDSRLFIERLLLPPGTTCSRAASTGLFFFMLYCFVWTSWYIAAGRVTCPAEAAASEALRPLQRVFRRVTGPGWSPFPGSDVGRPCLSRKTGIQVSFTAPVYAEDGYLSPPTNSCSEQSEARLAERSEMPS
ncbi:unnamed protein product [Durusdinium trenchii]|uniref:Uncharacterized protein n=1 Tax=Durusdinium trenchii TaxID=1381693 RepID=A0ABP0RXL5_9DINO